MRKPPRTLRRLAWFAVLSAGTLEVNPAIGEDVFSLAFDGPDALSGVIGETVEGTFACTLAHRGEGPGAAGWSFRVTAAQFDTRITAIRFEGTDAARLFQEGFEKSEVISPHYGAVSAVTLGSSPGVTLPPNSTQSIAFVTVEHDYTRFTGRFELYYLGHVSASGITPVTVVQAGQSVEPLKQSMEVLVEPKPCFGASKVNVGFSERPISSPMPYEGILGDGFGADGEVVAHAPEGRTGSAHVYLNIISDSIGPEGVQGWSFSVRLVGEGGMVAATTRGTSVDKYFHEGFQRTTTEVDESRGSSRRGVVTAVALSVSGFPAQLPVTGTESVLDMTIVPYPQERPDRIVTLWFEDGLTGPGQPVANVITVSGVGATICNLDFARVDLRFKLLEESLFIRGNANGDSRVDISDAAWILNELFLSGPPCPCQEAADANDDGAVDASDAVLIVRHQFLGGAAPAPPFPACGTVLEEDLLSCPEAQAVCY